MRLLLNMSEKPYTPQKLVMILMTILSSGAISSSGKSAGEKWSSSATTQPVIVAISIISRAYVMRYRPDLRSSFARSMPPVISGKPGITNSMEQMYPD